MSDFGWRSQDLAFAHSANHAPGPEPFWITTSVLQILDLILTILFLRQRIKGIRNSAGGWGGTLAAL